MEINGVKDLNSMFDDSYILSAGIVCYSIPPGSKDVFFLLGKQTNEVKNQIRKNWCDFAGKMEEGETIEYTAARELYEESLGLVNIEDEVNQIPSTTTKLDFLQKVSNSLSLGGYCFKIITCLNHGSSNESKKNRYHITFVLKISWNPHLPTHFSELRTNLLEIQNNYEHISSLCEQLLIRKSEHYYRTSLYPIPTCMYYSTLHGWVVVLEVKVVTITEQSIMISYTFQKKDDFLVSHDTLMIPLISTYGEYLITRNKFESSVNRDVLNHPSIYLGNFDLFCVREEYLEKDYIQFWSFNRLRDAINNGGYYKKEYFLSSFIPTMAVVLLKFTEGSQHEEQNKDESFMVHCKPQCSQESLLHPSVSMITS